MFTSVTLIGSTLAVIALGLAIAVRQMFIRQASALKVDHHYWVQAADYIRKTHKLPIRFDGRYLLEPRAQAYPPFFGWLLSKLPADWVSSPRSVWIAQAADFLALAIGIALGLWLGIGLYGSLALLVAVLFAPTLVAYNTQLNPRSFGNLFLVAKMACEVVAAHSTDAEAIFFWVLAASFSAAILLTHKMTTQLMIALWLPWSIALGSWCVVAIPMLGLGLAAAIVGPGHLIYQLIAHFDVIRFWNRNWPHLGCHAVKNSAIYGDGKTEYSDSFHKSGWRNIRHQLRLIVGYAPALAFVPVALLWSSPIPPWLIVWTFGSVAWAAMTGLIRPLKCLGAGPLYVFFCVIPAGLCLGLVANQTAGALATFATTIISLVALLLGWRQRQSRRIAADEGYSKLVEHLQSLPNQRIAVFPLTAAEAVIADTRHSVLWGGHGYGFDQLEPIFPRVTRPLGETLARYRIDRIIWNEAWWHEASRALANEFALMELEVFGSWRTARIDRLPPAPRIRVCIFSSRPPHNRSPSTEFAQPTEFEFCRLSDAPASTIGKLFGLCTFLRGYRELRVLRPDIADCRDSGPWAVLLAALAGVPHLLFRPPNTRFERLVIGAGVASVDVDIAPDRPHSLNDMYRALYSANRTECSKAPIDVTSVQ